VPTTYRLRIAQALLLMALTAVPLCGYGFGPEGHKPVVDLSSRFFTPAAKPRIAELLVNDLDAQGRPSGRTTLGEIDPWHDKIRSTPGQKAAAPWHYDDVPACGIAPKSEWCPNRGFASKKLV
jgi:hypothetical protein